MPANKSTDIQVQISTQVIFQLCDMVITMLITMFMSDLPDGNIGTGLTWKPTHNACYNKSRIRIDIARFNCFALTSTRLDNNKYAYILPRELPCVHENIPPYHFVLYLQWNTSQFHKRPTEVNRYIILDTHVGLNCIDGWLVASQEGVLITQLRLSLIYPINHASMGIHMNYLTKHDRMIAEVSSISFIHTCGIC